VIDTAGVTSSSHVRFVSWTAYLQMHNISDSLSVMSGSEVRSNAELHSVAGDDDDGDSDHPKTAAANRKVPGEGQPIKNGDIILLETDGMYVNTSVVALNQYATWSPNVACLMVRYMSVTKGWWLAWSSSTPRRSGAFIVEILEKAPQQSLSEQFSSRLLDIKVLRVCWAYHLADDNVL
jgi:hypothetical protein